MTKIKIAFDLRDIYKEVKNRISAPDNIVKKRDRLLKAIKEERKFQKSDVFKIIRTVIVLDVYFKIT